MPAFGITPQKHTSCKRAEQLSPLHPVASVVRALTSSSPHKTTRSIRLWMRQTAIQELAVTSRLVSTRTLSSCRTSSYCKHKSNRALKQSDRIFEESIADACASHCQASSIADRERCPTAPEPERAPRRRLQTASSAFPMENEPVADPTRTS